MRCVVVAVLMAASGVPSAGLEQPIETPHVSVQTSTSAVAPKMSLYADVSPKLKMHVYAPGEKDVIPVSLQLDPNPAIKSARAAFPAPEKYFFPPLKLTQLVYSKPFRITQPITVVKLPAADALTVTGTLEYQACDDAVCYVPKKVRLSWTIGNARIR